MKVETKCSKCKHALNNNKDCALYNEEVKCDSTNYQLFEPKEETIEEAALRMCDGHRDNRYFNIIRGAKWQKDRTKLGISDLSKDLQKLIESEREQRWIAMKFMYTEEEVKELCRKAKNFGYTANNITIEEWFEINKKI